MKTFKEFTEMLGEEAAVVTTTSTGVTPPNTDGVSVKAQKKRQKNPAVIKRTSGSKENQAAS